MMPFLRIARRNLAYKIVSLVLAVLLYGVAYTQQNPRATRTIPVLPEVRGLPSNLTLREAPGTYAVQVSGPAPLIEALDMRTLKAVVDVSGARQPGTARFPVTYSLPEGMDPEAQVANGPSAIPLTLERKVRRAFRVEVSYADTPPAGTEFTPPVTQPGRVSVVGREPVVEGVAKVVARVDTSGAAGAISEEAELVALDAGQEVVEGVEIQPPRVLVRIEIRPTQSIKALVLSPVLTGAPAPGFYVTNYIFDPQTVMVSGPQQRLAGVSSLEVPIAQDGLSETVTRTITLRPPPGLKFAGAAQARVTLVVKPVGTRPANP
jgi:YbbR domain-containing protein